MISRYLYTIGIAIIHAVIYLHSFINQKSRKLVTGRKGWRKKLLKLTQMSDKWLWIHLASHGEYEQSKPFIEKLLNAYPEHRILVTFFSPSGMENVSHEELRLHYLYLPWDYPRNSKDFLDILSPTAIIFNKYDFWLNLLHSAEVKAIPRFLINAYFDENHWIFRLPKDGFFDIPAIFTAIYTQDKATESLLNQHNPEKALFAGDTRLERVVSVSQKSASFPLIDNFTKNHNQILIAGSTWSEDERLLLSFLQSSNEEYNIGLILVPHEVNKSHVDKIVKLYRKYNPQLYSELQSISDITSSILIVDKIGMLRHLYRYGDCAYVGGGFGSGVHSLLEPLVYGLAVFFGPKNERSYHAQALKEKRLGYEVAETAELINAFAEAEEQEDRIKKDIATYIQLRLNASDKIIQDLNKRI